MSPTAPQPWITARVAKVTLVSSCVFAVYGVALPYLSRWLEVERALDGAEIGAVMSMAQLVRLAIGPLIALWADGVKDRRTPIRVLSVGALLFFACFFFVANSFPTLLLFGFLALACSQGLSPFIEGAVLRACDEGKVSYGLARGIGSAVFIVANVVGGILIAQFGIGAVVIWILSGLVMLLLSAWRVLDPEPLVRETRDGQTISRLESVRLLMRNRRFLIVIAACGLIQCAHAFYYSFSVPVWRGQEIAADVIGWMWGFGVAVEVAFLFSLPWIERRVSPEALILIGGGGGVVRWILMGFAPLGFALWPIQALHALSFAATHVGAMRLIYRETPASAAGMAQTLHAALASGTLMGLSTLLSGFLYDGGGAKGYWAMAVLALIGTAIATLLLAKPRTDEALAS